MAFDTFYEFFAMGGHAVYVWASWGLTLVLFLGLVAHAFLERRQILHQLQRRARREAHRQPRTDTGAPPISSGSEASVHDA